jgi:hypothetical protein
MNLYLVADLASLREASGEIIVPFEFPRDFTDLIGQRAGAPVESAD